MSMEKSGYNPAYIGTTSVKVPIDENGYIAPEGTTAAGTRRIQFNRVAAENNLADNEAVLNFFFGLINGRYNSASNQMTVKWETDEVTSRSE